jgi:hypothetical protein
MKLTGLALLLAASLLFTACGQSESDIAQAKKERLAKEKAQTLKGQSDSIEKCVDEVSQTTLFREDAFGAMLEYCKEIEAQNKNSEKTGSNW